MQIRKLKSNNPSEKVSLQNNFTTNISFLGEKGKFMNNHPSEYKVHWKLLKVNNLK